MFTLGVRKETKIAKVDKKIMEYFCIRLKTAVNPKNHATDMSTYTISLLAKKGGVRNNAPLKQTSFKT